MQATDVGSPCFMRDMHARHRRQHVDATFPRLLLAHAAERPDAPALREKEYGIWQTLSLSLIHI